MTRSISRASTEQAHVGYQGSSTLFVLAILVPFVIGSYLVNSVFKAKST